MSDEIQKTKKPEDALTVMESEALYKWRRGEDTTPLSPFVAVKMYELFLLGHTCEEIVRSNDNKFALGLVVDARLRHNWDSRREAYLEQLYAEAGTAVKQRQVEGAVFLSDMLAAAHKEYGAKFHKYLQTGDAKDLDDRMKISSITQYKMVIDGLKAITGQDKKAAPAEAPVVNINVPAAPEITTPTEAHNIIDMLNALDEAEPKKPKKS